MTGNENTEIAGSLRETLVSSELTECLIEAGDKSLDTLMPALGELPVLKYIVAVGKAVSSFRDFRLMKKIAAFLVDLSAITPEQRIEMIERLDREPVYAERAAEALVVLLDRVDSDEKAVWVARAFRAYAAKTITAEQLMRLNASIERVLKCDVTGIKTAFSAGSIDTDSPYGQAAVQAGLGYVESGFGAGGISPTETYELFIKHVLP